MRRRRRDGAAKETISAMAGETSPIAHLARETAWLCGFRGRFRIRSASTGETADIFRIDRFRLVAKPIAERRTQPETGGEQVAGISQGVVRLSLTREQVVQLDEYLEPATSAEIEPDSKGGLGETLAADVRELEAKVLAPTQRHEHPMTIWRRLAFFFRRLAG
jgi:hypothetical protein